MCETTSGSILANVNWLSVIVVTIVSFALGNFWHSKVIFGKPWAKDSGFKFDASKKSNFLKLFGFSALFHFILITGLDIFIGPGAGWLHGMLIGLAISLLFVSTSIAVTYLFVGRTVRLILIDAGFYVVLLTFGGLILGAW